MEAHVRIDEGVKRGPRHKQRYWSRTPKGQAVVRKLPTDPTERAQLLAHAAQRYAEGETLQAIASDLQCSDTAVRSFLLDEVGPEYLTIQTQGLLAKVSNADSDIDAAVVARDALMLAGAREKARFARMDLERRRPHLYGPKQEITQTITPVLHIHVDADPQQLGRDVTPHVSEHNHQLSTNAAHVTQRVTPRDAREQHIAYLASLSLDQLQALVRAARALPAPASTGGDASPA